MSSSNLTYSEKEEEYVVKKINRFYEYGGDLDVRVKHNFDESKNLNIHLFNKINWLEGSD